MEDAIFNILLYLDEQDLLTFCSVNKKYSNLGQNLYFWGLKFKYYGIPMIHRNTFEDYKSYADYIDNNGNNNGNNNDISTWFVIINKMIESKEEAIEMLQINKEQFQREEDWAYRKSKGQIIIQLDQPMDLYFLPGYENSLELVFTLNNTLDSYSLFDSSYTEDEMIDILTYFVLYQKIGEISIIEEWRYTKKSF